MTSARPFVLGLRSLKAPFVGEAQNLFKQLMLLRLERIIGREDEAPGAGGPWLDCDSVSERRSSRAEDFKVRMGSCLAPA